MAANKSGALAAFFLCFGFILLVVAAFTSTIAGLTVITSYLIVGFIISIAVGLPMMCYHIQEFYRARSILCEMYNESPFLCESCITDEDVYNFNEALWRKNYVWTAQDKWEMDDMIYCVKYTSHENDIARFIDEMGYILMWIDSSKFEIHATMSEFVVDMLRRSPYVASVTKDES